MSHCLRQKDKTAKREHERKTKRYEDRKGGKKNIQNEENWLKKTPKPKDTKIIRRQQAGGLGGWGGEGSLVSSFDLIQSFDLDYLLIKNECSNNRAIFISDELVELLMLIKEHFKNYLADFFC